MRPNINSLLQGGVCVALLGCGVALVLAERSPALGWALIVWSLALATQCVRAGSTPPTARRVRARRARGGSRSA